MESNDYMQTLLKKLRLQESTYSFLDTNPVNEEVVEADKVLTSSPEFREFLKMLASAETELDSDKVSVIQKQFCEEFTKWTKVSQLRVGFLMYLDKRINSNDFLDKVLRHLFTMCGDNIQDLDSHSLTALMLLVYFKRDLSMDDISEYLGNESF